ncbi:hypothetical protein DFS34DRAFT_603107 [Phlyctochytrium arcticum]|nr:hypothetical protein DFS34DRAFT_603107 [Phlyctochytrium arcticum]
MNVGSRQGVGNVHHQKCNRQSVLWAVCRFADPNTARLPGNQIPYACGIIPTPSAFRWLRSRSSGATLWDDFEPVPETAIAAAGRQLAINKATTATARVARNLSEKVGKLEETSLTISGAAMVAPTLGAAGKVGTLAGKRIDEARLPSKSDQLSLDEAGQTPFEKDQLSLDEAVQAPFERVLRDRTISDELKKSYIELEKPVIDFLRDSTISNELKRLYIPFIKK